MVIDFAQLFVGSTYGPSKIAKPAVFQAVLRGIGKSFQSAITAPRMNLTGYGNATAQSWRDSGTFETIFNSDRGQLWDIIDVTRTFQWNTILVFFTWINVKAVIRSFGLEFPFTSVFKSHDVDPGTNIKVDLVKSLTAPAQSILKWMTISVSQRLYINTVYIFFLKCNFEAI